MDSLHDRVSCDNIKAGGNISIWSCSCSRVSRDVGALDPQLNSIKVELSDARKDIMELKTILFELRKGAQTNATVIDSLAQKIELVIAKTGYPGPEKIGQQEEGGGETVAKKKDKIIDKIVDKVEQVMDDEVPTITTTTTQEKDQKNHLKTL